VRCARRVLRAVSERMREEEGEQLLGSWKKAEVGTGGASACVVGAESMAMRRSCMGVSEGKDSTDTTHRLVMADE
jgi:hypothetical protein